MNDLSQVGRMIQICERTEDVKKLRGLILSLAISGKLTSQESVTEDNCGTFGIPSDWKWCALSTIAACRGSAKIGSGGIKPSDWILDMEDIDGATGTVHTRATFKERVSLSTKSAFKPGDVLYGKLRPYLNKVVLADSPGFCTTEIIPITPGGTIESRYLQLVLRSPYFLTYVAKRSYGMKMPRLGTKDLESARIPLPPLAEQKRIVAKVDELMALCDRLEAQLKERDIKQAALAKAALAKFTEDPTPENLQLLFHPSFSVPPVSLRKAILTLAFNGKLVPQLQGEEPAATLLQKTREKKADLIRNGLVKKEPWSHKLQEAEVLYALPPGWEWTHISDTVEKVTVGFVGSMKQHYASKGVPFLRSQNVRENRYEPVGLIFISSDFHRTISKSTLRPGDLLVTRSGNVGVTCVVPEDLPEANCSDLVIIKRPLAFIPQFLSFFINSVASGQIEAKTVGIALTHFNTQSVAQMTVALPPLAEQRRIVAKVEYLLGLTATYEAQLEASRTTGEKLLEAMVAELTSA